jgi:signal transduction histidine kinase
MFIHILLVLAFAPRVSIPDSSAIDSLMQKNLGSSLSVSDKIRTLNNLAEELLKNNQSLSLVYAKQALFLAQKSQDSLGMAAAMNRIGHVMRLQGQGEVAFRYYFESLSISARIPAMQEEVVSYKGIGLILQEQGNFSKSLIYFQRALASANKTTDDLLIADAVLHVGNAFLFQKAYDNALNSFFQALDIWMKRQNREGMSNSYNNIGFVYKSKGEYAKALEYYHQALDQMRMVKNKKVDLSAILNNIGDIYRLTGQKERALNYYQQSLEQARQIGSMLRLKEAYTDLADIYFELKDFNQAFTYQKLHATIQDSLYRVHDQARFREIEERYQSQEKEKQVELRKKEREIESLKRKAEFQQYQLRDRSLLNTSLIIGMILTVLWVALIYQRYRERRNTSRLLQDQNRTIQVQNEELQATNERLKESEVYLLQLNGTKDKFFSIISHDLKSPLNSLTGFLQILDMQVDAFSPSELREFAKGMNKSVKSLLELLDNLLLWSRTQTNTIEFSPLELSLSEIVDGNINLLQAVAQNKAISLLSEVNPGLRVYADRNMLNSVLRNLISNAIKFTPSNGRILIRAQERNDQVEVSVIDNGIGMSEQTISQLFRLDTYHTTPGTANEKGNGLGLILVKEFAEKNGGSISVESKVGKGTTFTITLPAARPA